MIVKAIAFDFDGVILESVSIKTEAMASLFAGHGEHLAEIITLHKQNASISRFIKFDMIYRDILKEPLPQETKEELGRKFSGLVFEKVLACPYVSGAREFLQAHHELTPLFVVSGTPDGELSRIVSERGLSAYFRGVYGSTRPKEESLRAILADHGWRAGDLVFVGDGMTDYEAAAGTAVPFIGRVPGSKENPFPDSTIVVEDLRGLERALERSRPMFPDSRP